MNKESLGEAKESTTEWFHILKDGYYYLPESKGYTDRCNEAGVFSKKDAIDKAEKCNELFLMPICVDGHNSDIKRKIDELRLLIIDTGVGYPDACVNSDDVKTTHHASYILQDIGISIVVNDFRSIRFNAADGVNVFDVAVEKIKEIHGHDKFTIIAISPLR